MSTDFQIEPGISFSEWLHGQIAAGVWMERQGFFPDRVRRVAERLQRDRPQAERLVVEIPWLRCFTAFTAPGRYIYFSRRLLERCPDDETTAFVIAHEIAHHDLGHLRTFTGPFAAHARRLAGGRLAVLFFRHLQKRIYSVEFETEADRAAIDLCVAAGYDPFRCLRIFTVFERWFRYHGQLWAIYGPDPECDEDLSPEAAVTTRARIWFWQKRTGYLPLQDRHALVRRHAEARIAARA